MAAAPVLLPGKSLGQVARVGQHDWSDLAHSPTRETSSQHERWIITTYL